MQTRRKALITIFWQIFSYLVILILNVTLTKLILNTYGIDFNGFMRVNLILITLIASAESGLGIATTIFLYKPLREKNWQQVNYILSTTHRRNKALGWLGLVILGLVLVGYGLFTRLRSGGIHIDVPGRASHQVLYLWSISLIIIAVASRNILNMLFSGALQNLIKADHNNYIAIIIDLIGNVIVYGTVFALLTLSVDPLIPFLPFLGYSLITSGLIIIYVKRKYPWLKISKKRIQINRNLIQNSIPITVYRIGYGLLLNSDVIIVSIILGFTVGSSLAFFVIIAGFLRSIALAIVLSFQSFYGSLFAKEGRLYWQHYRKIEYWTYLLASVAFINQFITSPYLVNGLFGQTLDATTFTASSQTLYIAIFTKPTFSLIMALTTVMIIINEPLNIFIYAKNKYSEVARKYLILAIIYIVAASIFGLAFFLNNHYLVALYCIIGIKLGMLLVQYVYTWLFNFWNMTYNSRLSSFLPNLLVLMIPITISCLIMYLVIYPNANLTISAIGFPYSTRSAVLDWTFSKLVLFMVGVAGASLALPFGVLLGQKIVSKAVHLPQLLARWAARHPRGLINKMIPAHFYDEDLIVMKNSSRTGKEEIRRQILDA